MTEKLLKVQPWNSTINGHKPNPLHDARTWFDGWRNLGWVHGVIDGTNDARGCGEYIHVPVIGVGADEKSYRVRCMFKPGGRYRKNEVRSVTAVKDGHKWLWKLQL